METWLLWLLLLPSRVVFGFLAKTGLDRTLHFRPDAVTGDALLLMSAMFWLLVVCGAIWLRLAIIDIADPTWRQQQRERRKAARLNARVRPRGTPW